MEKRREGRGGKEKRGEESSRLSREGRGETERDKDREDS